MANSKKKTTTSGKKNTGNKKKTQTKKKSAAMTKKEQEQRRVIRDNVVMICVTVIAVLLFAGMLGYCGNFGAYCTQLLYGLFGRLAIAFPILLFALCAYVYAMRDKKGKYFKPALCAVLYVLLCLLAQLLWGNYVKGIGLSSIVNYSANTHLGGGLFGGALEIPIRSLFGLSGTILIDIAAIIVCLILLTGRNLIGSVANSTSKAYHKSKEGAAVRKEEKQRQKAEQTKLLEQREKAAKAKQEAARKQKEQREERIKQSRMYHKVDGVSLDTKIEDPDLGKKAKAAVASAQSAGIQIATPEPVIEEKEPIIYEEELSYDEIVEQEAQMPVEEKIDKPNEIVMDEPDEMLQIDSSTEDAYVFPPIELLQKPQSASGGNGKSALENQRKLQDTLKSFNVDVEVTGYQEGPTVTRYELLPAPGVKVSKIVSLADDLKLALAAAEIRIEAPIPGKSAIGIEVPNKNRSMVAFREVIDTPEFKNHKSNIVFAAGKDINGNIIVADIQKMPHLLIAGATGSGKSVCINTIVMSILYHASPSEVKLIMIDPKVVELSVYNGIPHLAAPVVTDPKKAAAALQWAVREMTDRYQRFAQENVRKIDEYNAKAQKVNASKEKVMEVLPHLVIIVDELADLMMVASKEVEEAICRLAQLARAAGIHLVIATQRPSVDVITGLIKANIPSRIAFATSSGTDSRTVLDMSGAEKLLGNGDMLYFPQNLTKPKRVQGAFISDEEVSKVTEFLKNNNEDQSYNEDISNHELQSSIMPSAAASQSGPSDDRDELFADAGRYLIESEKGSIGSLQRKFRIGFNRAARIVDQLSDAGVVGPEEGTKPRQVQMTIEQFEAILNGDVSDNEGEQEE